MPKPRISEEASKILQARRDAAAELQAIDGLERQISDPSVIRLAHARLYESAIMLKVVAGENIAASEFKAANDMVEAARQSAKDGAPVGINIRFVERAAGPPTADGAYPEVVLTRDEFMARGRVEAAERRERIRQVAADAVAPTPETKPSQASSSVRMRPIVEISADAHAPAALPSAVPQSGERSPAPSAPAVKTAPKPAPKTSGERHVAFHSGGFLRGGDLASLDENMGLMRGPVTDKFGIRYWPNPTRTIQ